MAITKSSTSNEFDPIVFKTIEVNMNLQPGSQSSIDFHRTLSEGDLAVFSSESIQAILSYKWRLVKK